MASSAYPWQELNALEVPIFTFLDRFTQAWPAVDALILRVSSSDLSKGFLFIAFCWWVWFRANNREQSGRDRAIVLAILFSSLLAVFACRVLAILLPFRARPLRNPNLAYQLPYGMEDTLLQGWSSFPSDHATLFLGLSAGFFFLSRRVGYLSFAYLLLFILIPRVYAGLHYPTDIVAGGIMGVVCTATLVPVCLRRNASQPILRWAEGSPASFYPLFFLFTSQVAMLFDGARTLAGYAKDLGKLWLG